jgi:hypothetical protein
MPGGVIKIKFCSSKHSGTQSITHHIPLWSQRVLDVIISEKFRPKKTPPAKGTPGG